MKRDSFVFKTKIGFGIKSDEIEPDVMTEELGLNPTHFYKKGDMFTSKFSPRIGHRLWNVWSIDSQWTVLEEETVRHHVEYFKKIFLPKADILKRYKEDSRFELSFWITVHTDDAGVGLYLLGDEMAFLNEFSNWVHLGIIANMDLDAEELTTLDSQ